MLFLTHSPFCLLLWRGKPYTHLFLNGTHPLWSLITSPFFHRKSTLLVSVAVEEGENPEKERKKATAANSDSNEPYHDLQSNSAVPDHTWKKTQEQLYPSSTTEIAAIINVWWLSFHNRDCDAASRILSKRVIVTF